MKKIFDLGLLIIVYNHTLCDTVHTPHTIVFWICFSKQQEMGADVVIALTHMRWPSDQALATAAVGVDLILGGHDHDMGQRLVNDTWIVKSGPSNVHPTCENV